MHGFAWRDGLLHCEEVPLQKLAEEHGTPLYVYSASTIRDHYQRLDQALAGVDHHIAYAVKANSNRSILRLLAGLGAGFDIVSGGELQRVIRAGGDPAGCTFAGVGKTAGEIQHALESGIFCINLESEDELGEVARIAGEMRVTAPVAVRVNPNVDAGTHKYISTGLAENKFGIDFDRAPALCKKISGMRHVRLRGLQMHIGSQITTVAPFVEAVKKVKPLARELKERHGIEFWSLGGGIGITYHHSLESGAAEWWEKKPGGHLPLTFSEYGEALVPLVADLGLKILLEPGRVIVGNAGVLLARCLYEKRGTKKTFKIVDAGMNDLIRPALYQGHHEIVPLRAAPQRGTKVVDVVGPVCESSGVFCENTELPDFHPGEMIALMSSGAYGFSMASNYNSRPLPAEILVEGAEARVIRRRQTLDDMLAQEL